MAVPAAPRALHVEQDTDEAKVLVLTEESTGEAFDLSAYEEFDFIVKADVEDADVDALFSYNGDGASGAIRFPSGLTATDGQLVVQFERADLADAGVRAWKLRATSSGPRYEVLAKGNLTIGD